MGESVEREGALDQLAAATRLAASGPEARLVLRVRPAGVAAASSAFGVDLPTMPCRAERAGACAALWLGPDEWLLLAPAADEGCVAAALEDGLAGHPHSLVTASHRQTAVVVDGARAAALLAIGCPLDLDLAAFPVGMCTRTLFAKAPIVLWRQGVARFRIEVWRSFAPYLWQVLDGGLREGLAE